jgi:heme-degrading monooxygenase HmoA
MPGRATVIVFLREEAPGEVARAYRETSWVTEPIPGLLSTDLVRETEDPARYLLLSRWTDLAAFRAWQSGPDHAGGAKTSPLRPYQDRSRGKHYLVYEQAGEST